MRFAILNTWQRNVRGPTPKGQIMKVQAFFAVTEGRGNANGYLNAQGEIAQPRAPHVLTRDQSKAQAAVDTYLAKSGKNKAKIGTVTCYPEWLS